MGDEKQASSGSYADFWPFYLSQHAKPLTRYLHIFGTLAGLLIFVIAVFSSGFIWLIAALIIGYGFAWLSHSFIEKNHPATFTYPLWSLRGDFHMLFLWLTGRLDEELAKYHIKG